jgi:asparagine synthase (glutamine-hydrolysing)
MCGITGFVDFQKNTSQTHLKNACNTLHHRGPDDQGVVILNASSANIGLGHQRLSILDISSLGHQPMFNEDKSIAIVLNGEIYNFMEIRKDLEAIGHRFRSNSDTEVAICAYEVYGMKCLDRFIGMFSIALYDANKQRFFMARDRAGVKPIYYQYKDGCLLFASELKALHQYPSFKKEINNEAVSLFFRYGYIKAPHCIFKDTNKLMPGHFAELNMNTGHLELHKYWDVLDYYNKPTIEIAEDDALKELDKLCTSAFQYRMVSDVPVGVFLSGGYDSSLVTAILQKNSTNKIKTFTIGFFEEKYNEANYAKKVAEYLGTDHHEYYCTTKEAQEIIPDLPFYYDEPFGDSSAIPTILVSRFARQQVTVALSADGGDEIFAGYKRYDQLTMVKKIRQLSPRFMTKLMAHALQLAPGQNAKLKKIAKVVGSKTEAAMNDELSRYYSGRELQTILSTSSVSDPLLIDESVLPGDADFINTLLAADYKTYLVDDILTKVDRATMSVGLEGREPFLDQRIIEYAAQLPSSLKYNKGNKKYLLKKLTHQYLPPEIMDRPKMGFSLPLNKWFRGDLKEYLYTYINRDAISQHGLVDGVYAEKIRDHFIAGKTGYETQIWLLLMFQLWWEKWMK